MLSYLLNNRSMCDTDTCCQLFYRYGEKIQAHLDTVDRTSTTLLNSHAEHSNQIAQKFMGGSHEIKRIFSQYNRKWCERRKQRLHIADHSEFLKETEEVFEMILSRIQDEIEHLYPLIRTIKGDAKRAA